MELRGGADPVATWIKGQGFPDCVSAPEHNHRQIRRNTKEEEVNAGLHLLYRCEAHANVI